MMRDVDENQVLDSRDHNDDQAKAAGHHHHYHLAKPLTAADGDADEAGAVADLTSSSDHLTGRTHSDEQSTVELSALVLAIAVPVMVCLALLTATTIWIAVRLVRRNAAPTHLGTPATTTFAQENDSFYRDNQLYRETKAMADRV
jgi:hypothetical protein